MLPTAQVVQWLRHGDGTPVPGGFGPLRREHRVGSRARRSELQAIPWALLVGRPSVVSIDNEIAATRRRNCITSQRECFEPAVNRTSSPPKREPECLTSDAHPAAAQARTPARTAAVKEAPRAAHVPGAAKPALMTTPLTATHAVAPDGHDAPRVEAAAASAAPRAVPPEPFGPLRALPCNLIRQTRSLTPR